jgi:hypothetical protein
MQVLYVKKKKKKKKMEVVFITTYAVSLITELFTRMTRGNIKNMLTQSRFPYDFIGSYSRCVFVPRMQMQ